MDNSPIDNSLDTPSNRHWERTVDDAKSVVEGALIANLPKVNVKHHAKGKTDGAFRFQVKDSGIEEFLKSLGKISQVRSNKLIEYVIYNDAFEMRAYGKHYYAKFVEYGYTKPNGKYEPGKRLFRKVKKRITRKIKEELKNVPRIFVMKYIEQAFENAVRYAVSELERETLIKTGRMAQSWSYYKTKDGLLVKSKGDKLLTIAEVEDLHQKTYQIHPSRSFNANL